MIFYIWQFGKQRVTPRKTCIMNQELYLFHRAGLIKDFNVRYAKHTDIDPIRSLIKNLQSRDQFMHDLDLFLKSKKLNVSVVIEAFLFFIHE